MRGEGDLEIRPDVEDAAEALAEGLLHGRVAAARPDAQRGVAAAVALERDAADLRRVLAGRDERSADGRELELQPAVVEHGPLAGQLDAPRAALGVGRVLPRRLDRLPKQLVVELLRQGDRARLLERLLEAPEGLGRRELVEPRRLPVVLLRRAHAAAPERPPRLERHLARRTVARDGQGVVGHRVVVDRGRGRRAAGGAEAAARLIRGERFGARGHRFQPCLFL
mmetsp:Transcript_7629/g.24999  ORF Transcript_7629/g.24999 Transcript_7629/m.24999 type:complete len:225 (+) Transcript_7629:1283-1957(+)